MNNSPIVTYFLGFGNSLDALAFRGGGGGSINVHDATAPECNSAFTTVMDGTWKKRIGKEYDTVENKRKKKASSSCREKERSASTGIVEGDENYYTRKLENLYSDIDIPVDLQPVEFIPSQNGFMFDVFESVDRSTGENIVETEVREEVGDGLNPGSTNGVERNRNITPEPRSGRRKKRVVTQEDKLYRADREYIKRHSHGKMIWFFRKLGLRHPAALRTHLERVKHPEFELPNLKCVLPHSEMAISYDGDCEEGGDGDGGGSDGTGCGRENNTNATYYQLYCPTPALVDHVKNMIGDTTDKDYKKKVLTFIADIVGRVLWHHNRTHTVMFAKSDHYDRDCFLLYSRQAEPTPYMMWSDSYFCRRHDSEKYRFIAPQPDLTRSHSSRLSNDSSIYVVGCNMMELWQSFPYEYRATRYRPLKALCDLIRQIDPSVMDYAFSPINYFINRNHVYSPYVDVASKTSFDILSVLLRDSDLKGRTIDDSVAYKSFVERFITASIMNVHALLKLEVHGVECIGGDSTQPPSCERFKKPILHHVGYRREVRELRTNRVFYYRNRDNHICSSSLLDNYFEDRRSTVDEVGEYGEKNTSVVYFYDLIQPFVYDRAEDVNSTVLHRCWEEVHTMLQESAYTIKNRLTDGILNGPVPRDPFYPESDMSATDVAIDRMLERAIKHSKKIKLSTTVAVKKGTSTRDGYDTNRPPLPFDLEDDPELDRAAILESISKSGDNRLEEGYTSPTRPAYQSDLRVEHNGQEFHVKLAVANKKERAKKEKKIVDYGPPIAMNVADGLMVVIFIDPKAARQIHITVGSRIIDRNHPEYVQLEMTDRIVRVFTIQVVNEIYLIKRHVYFVFRGLPTCVIDEDIRERLFEITGSCRNGLDDFNLFDQFMVDNNHQHTRVDGDPLQNKCDFTETLFQM